MVQVDRRIDSACWRDRRRSPRGIRRRGPGPSRSWPSQSTRIVVVAMARLCSQAGRCGVVGVDPQLAERRLRQVRVQRAWSRRAAGRAVAPRLARRRRWRARAAPSAAPAVAPGGRRMKLAQRHRIQAGSAAMVSSARRPAGDRAGRHSAGSRSPSAAPTAAERWLTLQRLQLQHPLRRRRRFRRDAEPGEQPQHGEIDLVRALPAAARRPAPARCPAPPPPAARHGRDARPAPAAPGAVEQRLAHRLDALPALRIASPAPPCSSGSTSPPRRRPGAWRPKFRRHRKSIVSGQPNRAQGTFGV